MRGWLAALLTGFMLLGCATPSRPAKVLGAEQVSPPSGKAASVCRCKAKPLLR